MPFEEDLLGFLGGARRILLVGIGNTVRKDDAAGVRVMTRMKGKAPSGVCLLDVGTTPENYTSKIKQLAPTHMIFIDAVEMGGEPGEYRFIDEETLVTQSVSTHKQPLGMLMAVLREGLPDSAIRLVGVQPKNTEFGCGMSAPVERGVRALVEVLLDALRRVERLEP